MVSTGAKTKVLLAITISLLIHFQRTFADDPADRQSIYVDKGACPGEWCAYGEWEANEDTILYDAPSNDAEELKTIKPGTKVKALAGEVHAKPVKFIVKRDINQYKKTISFGYIPT